jgi:hypothetical protein
VNLIGVLEIADQVFGRWETLHDKPHVQQNQTIELFEGDRSTTR